MKSIHTLFSLYFIIICGASTQGCVERSQFSLKHFVPPSSIIYFNHTLPSPLPLQNVSHINSYEGGRGGRGEGGKGGWGRKWMGVHILVSSAGVMNSITIECPQINILLKYKKGHSFCSFIA